jgi:hypothetical protein
MCAVAQRAMVAGGAGTVMRDHVASCAECSRLAEELRTLGMLAPSMTEGPW